MKHVSGEEETFKVLTGKLVEWVSKTEWYRTPGVDELNNYRAGMCAERKVPPVMGIK